MEKQINRGQEINRQNGAREKQWDDNSDSPQNREDVVK